MKAILIATLIVVQLATAVARHERSDHRCGRSFDGCGCRYGRCCSTGGYCGKGSKYCGGYTCASQCPFETPSYEPYNAIGYNYSHNLEGTSAAAAAADGESLDSCAATYRANMSMAWIQEYGRTVFCGRPQAAAEESDDNGTSTVADACGHCLKVTRRATGAQTTVRLLQDECSKKGPMLGNTIFRELDKDGEGAVQGYLMVDYQAVHCPN